ncbi:hypothetical protein ACFL0M_13110 [Thermodesulfobacteriota bacterium]
MVLRLKRFYRIFGTDLMFLVCMFILFEIPAAATSNEATVDISSTQFRQIALMPFLLGEFESLNGQVDKPLSQPLSQTVFNRQNLRDDADQVLTRIVADTLKTWLTEKLIPTEKAQSVFDEISKNDTFDTPKKLAKALGEKLQAELVVVGSVWRYRDRGGIKDIPDAPASVAFEIYLVEVDTGKRLWRGKFDGTQKTLSKDVIRGFKQMKMEARWLTADELARYGVREIFKKFPIR